MMCPSHHDDSVAWHADAFFMWRFRGRMVRVTRELKTGKEEGDGEKRPGLALLSVLFSSQKISLSTSGGCEINVGIQYAQV